MASRLMDAQSPRLPGKPTKPNAPAATESPSLRVEALAAQAGISVDTVRYYQKLGMLPGPTRVGRVGYYGADHVERLDRIAALAAKGFTLAQIREVLDGDSDPLLAELVRQAHAHSPSGSPATYDRSELAELSGLDAGLVDLAISSGLVSPVVVGADRPSLAEADAPVFGPDALDMLTAAAKLVSSGLPLDQLAGLVSRHAAHVDAIVDDAIEVFRANTAADRSQQSETVQELIPVVSMLVGTHFERTLLARALDRLRPEDPT